MNIGETAVHQKLRLERRHMGFTDETPAQVMTRVLISRSFAWAGRISLRNSDCGVRIAVKVFFDGPHITRDIHLDGIIRTFRNTDSVSVF